MTVDHQIVDHRTVPAGLYMLYMMYIIYHDQEEEEEEEPLMSPFLLPLLLDVLDVLL